MSGRGKTDTSSISVAGTDTWRYTSCNLYALAGVSLGRAGGAARRAVGRGRGGAGVAQLHTAQLAGDGARSEVTSRLKRVWRHMLVFTYSLSFTVIHISHKVDGPCVYKAVHAIRRPKSCDMKYAISAFSRLCARRIPPTHTHLRSLLVRTLRDRTTSYASEHQPTQKPLAADALAATSTAGDAVAA